MLTVMSIPISEHSLEGNIKKNDDEKEQYFKN